MGFSVGIDIGGTTTDLVAFNGDVMLEPVSVSASDPIASATGALGKFLLTHKLSLSAIDNVGLTGVGSTFFEDQILGLPIQMVSEFEAIGRGGAYLSGEASGLVVSMGTGTAMVYFDQDSVQHVGGSGIGGGTLKGLAHAILGISDLQLLEKMSEVGDLKNVDLRVGDIVDKAIDGLPAHLTASNFGKSHDSASAEDYAVAILNMICQSVGVLANAHAMVKGTNTIIVTGKLATLGHAKQVFDQLSVLYNKRYIIVPQAASATAVGAALIQ